MAVGSEFDPNNHRLKKIASKVSDRWEEAQRRSEVFDPPAGGPDAKDKMIGLHPPGGTRASLTAECDLPKSHRNPYLQSVAPPSDVCGEVVELEGFVMVCGRYRGHEHLGIKHKPVGLNVEWETV